MHLIKQLCSCCVFLCLTTLQIKAQALDLINEANLVTISSLTNSQTPYADSINFIPRFLLQTITLIERESQVISRRLSDNTLVNNFEKFAFVAKGIFQNAHTLNAKSYEIAISSEAKTGRISLYSDLNFQFNSIMMRWRKLKDGTQFSLKRLIGNTIKEETLRIDTDGSGFYELTLNRQTTLFLKWNQSGKLLTHQGE
jgi:hypothetical protein